MIKKVGTFKTTDSLLRITDPCYDASVWCSGTISNCEIGTWSAFLICRKSKEWGNRVAEIVAIYGEIEISDAQKILDENIWEDTGIDVGVDSGQAGIFQDSKYPISKGEYGDLNSFYGKCCKLTLGKEKGGVLDFGVVSSSGFGDGSYECFITTNDNNVYGVRVVFMNEIEINLEN